MPPKVVLLDGLGGTHRYWKSGLDELTGQFLPGLLQEYLRENVEDLLIHNFLSSTTTLWQVAIKAIGGTTDRSQ
jgi:hypothetical protein